MFNRMFSCMRLSSPQEAYFVSSFPIILHAAESLLSQILQLSQQKQINKMWTKQLICKRSFMRKMVFVLLCAKHKQQFHTIAPTFLRRYLEIIQMLVGKGVEQEERE